MSGHILPLVKSGKAKEAFKASQKLRLYKLLNDSELKDGMKRVSRNWVKVCKKKYSITLGMIPGQNEKEASYEKTIVYGVKGKRMKTHLSTAKNPINNNYPFIN